MCKEYIMEITSIQGSSINLMPPKNQKNANPRKLIPAKNGKKANSRN